MEEAVKQRIREVLYAKDSNPTKLSKECLVNQKTLNNQINSDVQLSASTILLILSIYPDVSAEWLMRGVGDMFLSGDVKNASAPTLKYDAEVEIGEDGYLKIKIKK